MVIFLSTGMLEELSKRLIEGGYQPETPAAIVYKATWEDEKVCRCKVKDLAVTAKENGITKTALIVVGEVLGGEYEQVTFISSGVYNRVQAGQRKRRCRKCVKLEKSM